MGQLNVMPPVHRLDLATVRLPKTHPAAARSTTVPVYGFCIEHPDGAILVDTGVGFGNEFIDAVYHPQRQLLDELLGSLGISHVVAVVNSHLHFDHCGQNSTFYGNATPFYAQDAEIRSVKRDPTYTDTGWALAPEPQQRVIHGDERIADGVRIIATPGHTAGHQSVVVEAAGQRVVIGAQVVWHVGEFETEQPSAANVDDIRDLQLAAVDSIRRLKALEPDVIHLSHCPAYLPARPDSPAS